MLILWCALKSPSRRDDGHLAGRYLLSRGLELLGCPGGEARIRHEPGGKPFIPGGPEFSIAHCAAAALCALDGRPLGADVEDISVPLPEELLSALTAWERDWVLSAPDGERERRFYTVWTVKESLAKASGAGLGGLRELESAVTPELALKRRVAGLHVHILDLPGEGLAAAVSAADDGTPGLVRLSFKGV